MVGWLIVLGILALLLGLLLSPFSFAWDYDAPKDRFFWKLSWLGISFADSAGKGLFQREKEESRKPEKEPEQKAEAKPTPPEKPCWTGQEEEAGHWKDDGASKRRMVL
mgnify:CR=1 FL=1